VRRAIDVVCDANVVLKWFHEEDDAEVVPARALLTAHRDGLALVRVLDLTGFEIANALLKGRAHATASRIGIVLEALFAMVPVVPTTLVDLRLASALAERHGLTVYDAAYAAVAERHGAVLATTDAELIETGLGALPSALAMRLGR
jgi:predicted nucleic acid-binding protein